MAALLILVFVMWTISACAGTGQPSTIPREAIMKNSTRSLVLGKFGGSDGCYIGWVRFNVDSESYSVSYTAEDVLTMYLLSNFEQVAWVHSKANVTCTPQIFTYKSEPSSSSVYNLTNLNIGSNPYSLLFVGQRSQRIVITISRPASDIGFTPQVKSLADNQSSELPQHQSVSFLVPNIIWLIIVASCVTFAVVVILRKKKEKSCVRASL